MTQGRGLPVLLAFALCVFLPGATFAQTSDVENESNPEVEVDNDVMDEAHFAPAAPTPSSNLPGAQRRTPLDESDVSSLPQNDESDVSSLPQNEKKYYGNAILATDLAAVGLGVVAVGTKDAAVPLLIGAGLTYALGGPIVHCAHDRVGTALGSLALRVALPVSGGLLGWSLGEGSSRGCTGDMCGLGAALGGLALGFGAGMFFASLIDIKGLAYEAAPTTPAPKVALVPTIDPKKGSVGLNVQGVW